MNAISTNYGAGFAETAPPPRAPRPAAPPIQANTLGRNALGSNALGPNALGPNALGLGLQLSRANAMALTRLQLALCTGERRQALEAIDRLHSLDAQLERLVERLDAPAADPAADEDWRALSAHLADQKLALAFEKLALASGISGPDLRSNPAHPPTHPEALAAPASHSAAPDEDAPPLIDWHAFPTTQPAEWNPFAHRSFTIAAGAFLALVVTVLLAGAAVMMAG